MDMTAYFMGRNAAEAGGGSSGDSSGVTEITEDTFVYNLDDGIYHIDGNAGATIYFDDVEGNGLQDGLLLVSCTEDITYNWIAIGRDAYWNEGIWIGYTQQLETEWVATYSIAEKEDNKVSIINDNTINYAYYPSVKAMTEYVEEQLKNVGGSSSGEEWEHICDIKFVTDEEVTVVTQDLGAEYKKLLLYTNKDSAGGLTSDARDSYVFEIRADNKIISRVGNNRNGGWSLHVFNIEWLQDISIFLSEHFDGGLNGKEGISGTRTTPFTKLSFHTDGTKPDGTVCTFGNFTMNIYGVRV